ncbi:MAG: VWA domain-containing protein [Anaerolineae bacterium]|nr:VWA domain-containing protein [Anaerolineae bacterium]MDW7991845.1 VWA domain-containing protein [Anaerolineae bacterium]
MRESLSLAWSLNVPAIPVTTQPRLVYLLLEVKGVGGPAALPVNLAIVVDVSDSMHIRLVTEEQFRVLAKLGILQEVLVDGVPAWQSAGIPEELLAILPRKIDRVQDALRAAVEQLRPGDRFALVAFAGDAVTLIPNSPGSEKRRLLSALEGLDQLQLGDETRIGRGMRRGLEELRRGTSPGMASRMLVLTDGFTLDEEECRALAAQAVQQRIPISTMGLGGEFNEELMIPIADQTGGEAYLLERAEDIPRAFAQELQRAQAVQYRNAEVKLRPTAGVEIRAAFRVRPSIAPLETINEGGSYSFPLGDLLAGEESALLVELIVPPRAAGVYRLAQALLACDDPAGGMAGLKARADIVAEYTADVARAAQEVPQVMHVVEAVSAYRLQARAQADLQAGDVAGATRKLRAAATRLLEMGEAELAAEMERQAADLERSGRADPGRTKKLRYETRKLTQKLGE